jgi:NTP pyrophosphatase (non-canonical NTP hydrolase)
VEHFNKLSPAEAERLALLAEECGEVVQAIGKVLRHGFGSSHPDGGPTNREALERECGDVHHAIWRLTRAGDIDGDVVLQRADEKAKSVMRYLHHQGRVASADF